MKKRALLIIGALILPFCPSIKAQDWGSDLSLGATWNFAPKLSASLEEDFRLRDDFGTADRFSHTLDLSYKPFKFLKVGGAYNLINMNQENKGWEVRHRYYFYATGSLDLGRFNISLRERYQSTKRVGVEETKKRANPKEYLRSKLAVSYDLPHSAFSPFVSAELYKPLNDPVSNKADKLRYTAGVEYKINKHCMLEVFYRRNTFIDDDEESDSNIIGAGFTYKF